MGHQTRLLWYSLLTFTIFYITLCLLTKSNLLPSMGPLLGLKDGPFFLWKIGHKENCCNANYESVTFICNPQTSIKVNGENTQRNTGLWGYYIIFEFYFSLFCMKTSMGNNACIVAWNILIRGKNKTKTHSGIVVCEAEGIYIFITFFKVTNKKDGCHCASNNAGAVVLI